MISMYPAKEFLISSLHLDNRCYVLIECPIRVEVTREIFFSLDTSVSKNTSIP